MLEIKKTDNDDSFTWSAKEGFGAQKWMLKFINYIGINILFF